MAKKKKSDYENPYDNKCSIVYAMELIGAKWKIPIIVKCTPSEQMHPLNQICTLQILRQQGNR